MRLSFLVDITRKAESVLIYSTVGIGTLNTCLSFLCQQL